MFIQNLICICDHVFGSMLRLKAEDEGILVVQGMQGGHTDIGYNYVLSVVYTHPELL